MKAALLASAAIALALPAATNAGIVGISFTPDGAGGGELKVEGAPLTANDITVREKTNPKTGEKFLEISDPAGVLASGVPPGCTLAENPGGFPFEVRCPIQGITRIAVTGGIHEDTVLIDLDAPIEVIVDLRGGDDTATGGPGPDTQIGGAGDDRLFGGPGADAQGGGPGADRLSGDAGNDRQTGGPGNDFIHGGSGKDTGNGGKGTDRCRKVEAGPPDCVMFGKPVSG